MMLTRDNYYSPEADRFFMSCSQYQSFLECEAAAMAKLYGGWKGTGDSTAFLVGNYFHSYFESPEAHKAFCDEHFDNIFKTKTTKARGTEVVGKYAEYVQADRMIQKVENDPVCKRFLDMQGENEVIMTGELFGIPWRIRMDKYCPESRIIIDYKTSKNLRELFYNPLTRERETFIEHHGYLMRAAVYSEIEKRNAGQENDPLFIIIGVSKQDFPDIDVLSLNHRQRWDMELEQVKKNIARIQRLKTGQEAPKRCGVCEYCRATSKVKRIKPYYELKPEFRTEDDFDDFYEILAEGKPEPL